MDKKRLKNSIIGGLAISFGTLLNGSLGIAIIKTDNLLVTLFCWLIAVAGYEVTLSIIEKTNR